jgi:hypothetical protein
VTAVPASQPVTLPAVLPDLPDVADHRIAGKATVPAVELLELLARFAAGHMGWGDSLPLPLAMTDVVFPRFLLVQAVPRCTFAVRLASLETGLRASLTSTIGLPNRVKRLREHAVATFAPPPSPPSALPAPDFDFEIEADRVYRELIPFGPRYRNLRGTIRLGRAGATGLVRSPEPPRRPPPLAGCPFLLDGAMHLACLWGQRYAGYIAYPTGFAARVLHRPVAAGERRCVVAPRFVSPRRVLCDLWLSDEAGVLCDAVTGLTMSPLVNGPAPPSWIALAGAGV